MCAATAAGGGVSKQISLGSRQLQTLLQAGATLTRWDDPLPVAWRVSTLLLFCLQGGGLVMINSEHLQRQTCPAEHLNSQPGLTDANAAGHAALAGSHRQVQQMSLTEPLLTFHQTQNEDMRVWWSTMPMQATRNEWVMAWFSTSRAASRHLQGARSDAAVCERWQLRKLGQAGRACRAHTRDAATWPWRAAQGKARPGRQLMQGATSHAAACRSRVTWPSWQLTCWRCP